MTITSIHRPLWLDLATGAVECSHHSIALEAAARRDPDAHILVTDLGVYSRVTAADVTDWTAAGQDPITCDACRCAAAT